MRLVFCWLEGHCAPPLARRAGMAEIREKEIKGRSTGAVGVTDNATAWLKEEAELKLRAG